MKFVTLLLILAFLLASVHSKTKDLETNGVFQYVYFPFNGTIRFKVKGPNDVFVNLVGKTPLDINTDPFVEVVFGAYGNQVSGLRTSRNSGGIFKVDTPNALSTDEYRGFWIKVVPPIIMAGHENEHLPFIFWKHPNMFPITHFGLGGPRHLIQWKLEEDYIEDVLPCKTDDIKLVDDPWGDQPVHMVKDSCYKLISGFSCQNQQPNMNFQKAENKKYTIYEGTASWDSAKVICETKGHKLATVRTKEQQAKLEKVIKDYRTPMSGVWLAANDRVQHNQFKWQDGSNDPLTFTNWESRVPPVHDVTGKNCVFASYVALVVKQSALWFVQNCDEEYNVICESY